MTFGPYPLPSARRSRHESLDRYVRHEYREDSAYWLTTINGHGTRISLPSERPGYTAQDNGICNIQTRQAETMSCCPVLNAVSKGRLTADTPSRGD
ncbi:MAG TPA: hypothetical protein VMW88_05640 [Thermoplasmata archaeon]|nr:hypothetical protein [Thermoplasmata archaeon]